MDNSDTTSECPMCASRNVYESRFGGTLCRDCGSEVNGEVKYDFQISSQDNIKENIKVPQRCSNCGHTAIFDKVKQEFFHRRFNVATQEIIKERKCHRCIAKNNYKPCLCNKPNILGISKSSKGKINSDVGRSVGRVPDRVAKSRISVIKPLESRKNLLNSPITKNARNKRRPRDDKHSKNHRKSYKGKSHKR